MASLQVRVGRSYSGTSRAVVLVKMLWMFKCSRLVLLLPCYRCNSAPLYASVKNLSGRQDISALVVEFDILESTVHCSPHLSSCWVACLPN
jgi:hypothetical protein